MFGKHIRYILERTGIPFTIVRSSEVLSGEYLSYEPNAQVTKPFIREFFLEAKMQDNTSGEAGDLLRFTPSGDYYLVMHKTPRSIGGEAYQQDSVLHKCNVSGELKRSSGEDWDAQTYQKTHVWTTIETDVYGLLTEPLFGSDLDTEEELGLLGIERQQLYIPSSHKVQILDRYQPDSGEYYMVKQVMKRRYPGIDMVELTEDTRD